LKLPNADRAQIAPEKILGYLLSPVHPSGRSKARFFRRLGFTLKRGSLLARALLRIAEEGEVVETVGTPFGTKYVVVGDLETPHENRIRLTTVWIILDGEDVPRFVTAYPVQE
jgi:hypothetical protein